MAQVKKVMIIGAGLAGVEAATFLASRGIQVILVENKTLRLNPAQKNKNFAELVCTNSLKSMDVQSSHGLLKYEMEKLGSVILEFAKKNSVPAGDALAVDREKFSQEITHFIKSQKNIELVEREATDIFSLKEEFKADYVVIASGPLTTVGLSEWIKKEVCDVGEDFYFYDAIAPVVDADTLDFSKLYAKDRWKDNEEKADYLNAPMNKEQYEQFIEALVAAEKTKPKDFESEQFFESCLPIDVMAERGKETPRFSCMKPIGLKMKDGTMPYAVVQLRKENLLGSAFNLVGFQTRLTYKDQVRVFRMIPGFENASFIHLGSVHRNSFLNAKKLFNPDLSCKKLPWLYFAGQMTGVEGYTESSACGVYVGLQLFRKISGIDQLHFPIETAIGALINYIMTAEKPMPSNINFGLFPLIDLTKEQRKNKDKKALRKEMTVNRSIELFNALMKENVC